MLYNVLIVEDDRQMAQGLAAQVGVLGHTVVIAYGPRMAITQLNQVIPDAVSYNHLTLPTNYSV